MPPFAANVSHFDKESFDRFFSSIMRTTGDPKSLENLLGKARLNTVEESALKHCLKQMKDSFSDNLIDDTAKILGFPVMTLRRNLATAMVKIGGIR